jgi:hypothetical protein
MNANTLAIQLSIFHLDDSESFNLSQMISWYNQHNSFHYRWTTSREFSCSFFSINCFSNSFTRLKSILNEIDSHLSGRFVPIFLHKSQFRLLTGVMHFGKIFPKFAAHFLCVVSTGAFWRGFLAEAFRTGLKHTDVFSRTYSTKVVRTVQVTGLYFVRIAVY